MYNQYNYTILLKTNTNTKFNAKSFRFLYKLKNKLYTIKKKAKFNFIKNDIAE